MKKKIAMIATGLVVLLLSVTFYSSGFAEDKSAVEKTELVAESPSTISLEVKEHYKLDNAEYQVATNYGGLSTGELVSISAFMLGLLLFFASLRAGLWKFSYRMQMGAGLLFLLAMAFTVNVGTLAIAPFLKFDKAGLEGDNLKFVLDLEKRITGMDDEAIKRMLKDDLKLAVREATEQFKRFESLDEANVTKLKEMLGEDDKGIRSILLKQGEAITALKSNIDKAEERMDIRSQVKEYQTRNKDIIAKIKEGNGNLLKELPALEIRAAASPMTPANTISDTITINAGAAIRMGAPVFELRRAQPTLWDYINKGRTGLETYPWVNKKVPADSGAADFIGPGVAKPGVSFTLEVEKSNAKKVAVSLKTATELLDDVDGFTTFIQDELAYQLKLEVNTDLMTQTESTTKIAGLQTFSLPFTTSGLSTVNPNNWDVCRAIIAQIRLAFISSPVVIFMNPVDVANMDMDKSVSMGIYSGISARPIPGGLIVEDVNMTAGYVQAVALDLWKNLIYKDFAVKWGHSMDDFEKNLITAIAELRMHSFHSENDAAGFVFDAIADVKTAIAAA